jgi:hypothetical protein
MIVCNQTTGCTAPPPPTHTKAMPVTYQDPYWSDVLCILAVHVWQYSAVHVWHSCTKPHMLAVRTSSAFVAVLGGTCMRSCTTQQAPPSVEHGNTRAKHRAAADATLNTRTVLVVSPHHTTACRVHCPIRQCVHSIGYTHACCTNALRCVQLCRAGGMLCQHTNTLYVNSWPCVNTQTLCMSTAGGENKPPPLPRRHGKCAESHSASRLVVCKL